MRAVAALSAALLLTAGPVRAQARWTPFPMPYEDAAGQRPTPRFAFATDGVARVMSLPPLRAARLPDRATEIRVWVGFGVGAPHILVRLTERAGRTRGEYVHWWTHPDGLPGDSILSDFILDMRRAAEPHGCNGFRPGRTEWVDGRYGKVAPLPDVVYACRVGFGAGEPDWEHVLARLDSLGVRDLVDPATLDLPPHIVLDGTGIEVEVLEGARYHAYTYRFPGARPEEEAKRAAAMMRLIRNLAPDGAYLTRGATHLRIGALDDPEHEVFGAITALRANDAGDIFVLDGIAKDVRWFDRKGAFRGRAGREGAGPGELRAPAAMVLGTDGLVHVLDPPNLKVSTFRASPEGLVHLTDTRVPPAYDFCALGDRRFILFPTPAGLLHEIDGDGRVVATFGSEARAESPAAGDADVPPDLRRELDGRGRVYCDQWTGRVLYLSERLPLVASYSPDGGLEWRTELRGYHRARWARSTRGGIAMAPDPATGTAHTGRAILSDGRHVYVVLHEGSLADPGGALELRVLRAADGVEVRAAPLDFVLTEFAMGRFYGHRSEPFPTVVVR